MERAYFTPICILKYQQFRLCLA